MINDPGKKHSTLALQYPDLYGRQKVEESRLDISGVSDDFMSRVWATGTGVYQNGLNSTLKICASLHTWLLFQREKAGNHY